MSYWNHSGKYQPEAELFGELVPGSGMAETFHGELFRAASKIYHDYFNNGFGNTRDSPAAFLLDHIKFSDDVKNMFYEYGLGNICYSNEEDVLEEMINIVIEHLLVTDNKPNSQDMWDYKVKYSHKFEEYEYEEEEE